MVVFPSVFSYVYQVNVHQKTTILHRAAAIAHNGRALDGDGNRAVLSPNLWENQWKNWEKIGTTC